MVSLLKIYSNTPYIQSTFTPNMSMLENLLFIYSLSKNLLMTYYNTIKRNYSLLFTNLCLYHFPPWDLFYLLPSHPSHSFSITKILSIWPSNNLNWLTNNIYLSPFPKKNSSKIIVKDKKWHKTTTKKRMEEGTMYGQTNKFNNFLEDEK